MQNNQIIILKNKFEKIENLYKKYEQTDELFNTVYSDMNNFKLNVPFVGSFSSGKTSLINAILNKQLFKAEITPETSIPVELTYSEKEEYIIIKQDNSQQTITEEELKTIQFDITKDKFIIAKVNNDFLKQISEIKLVDMPGFDSGIDNHNKAIDEYIIKSMAYIIVNDAENGTVRKSILDLLNELKMFNMPVYSVVNKADKKKDSINEILNVCKNDMENVLNIKNLKIAPVSARKKEIAPLKEYLIELNSKSEEIFNTFFTNKFTALKNKIKKYLEIRLKNSDKDFTQIELEEKRLNKSLEGLDEKFKEITANLGLIYDETISDIKNALTSQLYNNVPQYAEILASERDIKPELNRTIRVIVLDKFKNKFEVKVVEYLERLKDDFETDGIGEINISDTVSLNDNVIRNAIQSGIVYILSLIGITLGGPIGALVGMLIGIVVDFLMGTAKREARLAKITTELQNKIPGIVNDVIDSLDSNKENILGKIKGDIRIKIESNRKNIENSLNDVKKQLEKSIEEQNNIKEQIKEDLNSI